MLESLLNIQRYTRESVIFRVKMKLGIPTIKRHRNKRVGIQRYSLENVTNIPPFAQFLNATVKHVRRSIPPRDHLCSITEFARCTGHRLKRIEQRRYPHCAPYVRGRFLQTFLAYNACRDMRDSRIPKCSSRNSYLLDFQ